MSGAHRKCGESKFRSDFISGWKNGTLDISIGSGHNRRINKIAREYLLDRAKICCEQCGWGETNPFTGKVPLETDHINGNPFDDRYENFIVLCPNCHSLKSTHKGANRGRGRSKVRTNLV